MRSYTQETLDHPKQHDGLLTIAEVADLLRVPKSWIYQRTRRRGIDRLPHVKLGKYLRFRIPEVHKWLDQYREI